MILGTTESFGAGSDDAWVLKLDLDGDIVWQKSYGRGGSEGGRSVCPTSDGGYMIAGSFEGDAWVLKLNSHGDVAWQKTYGGNKGSVANSISPSPDGGFVVAGITESFGAGLYDAWALKLDFDGDVVWQKSYGGEEEDMAMFVCPEPNGGYAVAGSTESFGRLRDFWILRTDSNGNIDNCSFVRGSGAEASDTTIIPADTHAEAHVPNITIVETSGVARKTEATVKTQFPVAPSVVPSSLKVLIAIVGLASLCLLALWLKSRWR